MLEQIRFVQFALSRLVSRRKVERGWRVGDSEPGL